MLRPAFPDTRLSLWVAAQKTSNILRPRSALSLLTCRLNLTLYLKPWTSLTCWLPHSWSPSKGQCVSPGLLICIPILNRMRGCREVIFQRQWEEWWVYSCNYSPQMIAASEKVYCSPSLGLEAGQWLCFESSGAVSQAFGSRGFWSSEKTGCEDTGALGRGRGLVSELNRHKTFLTCPFWRGLLLRGRPCPPGASPPRPPLFPLQGGYIPGGRSQQEKEYAIGAVMVIFWCIKNDSKKNLTQMNLFAKTETDSPT